MTKTEYRATRRLIRDNGRTALGWIKGQAQQEWNHLLFNIEDSKDHLAERADIIAYCRAGNFHCTVRHTARRV